MCIFFPDRPCLFPLSPAATFKRSRLPPINQGLYSRIGVYFLHRTTHRLGSITLRPSYVSALLRRFTAMINSPRFARSWCIFPPPLPAGGREREREKEREGVRSKKEKKKSERIRRGKEERGRKEEKKRLSRYISRDYFTWRLSCTDTRYPASAMSKAIQTIPSPPSPSSLHHRRFSRSLYETFAYDESGTITIQSPSPGFVCILSSPPCLSRFTYGHGHRLELRIYVYTYIRCLVILLLLFSSFHFFSFIFRFPLFLFLLIIIIIVIIFISMCQSPDDVCLSTESIIVLHVFAIAKPITCHKCAVAAHFEQRCEASYTLWIMDNRARLFSTFTTREIISRKRRGK